MAIFKKFACSASVAALAALAPLAAVHAQQTTGSVRALITDQTGAPVAGASVTIIHEPTGSATVLSSTSNGVVRASNLRVGGPYVMTVSAAGYARPASRASASIWARPRIWKSRSSPAPPPLT
jgi:hypothetical protein